MYLKQGTSTVINFGPFVNPSDGVTLVTSLVSAIDHASTGIMVSKNGGSLAVRHATVTASTYDAYGFYKVTLDTTDTATCGELLVCFAAAASCLPVWQRFKVVSANIYDSMIAGTDIFDVSATQFAGQTITAAAGVTLGTTVAAVSDIPTATQNADALLNRDMSAVTVTNQRSPINALRKLINKWTISGSTLTVKEEDDSTTAYTQTVSKNASAEPIVGLDTV